uniref:Acyloxyacyl hydrolase n=1 Tax=Desulfobacca acetoxidans TaxID=60893 RepID=A0A7V4LBM2_9BACT
MAGKVAKRIGLLVLAMVLWGSPGGWGADFDFSDTKYEAGLRFGYGQALSRGYANIYSLLPRWGVMVARPYGSLPGGLGFSVIIEGIVSVADSQNTGFEIGFTPLLKLTLPLSRGLMFFIEGGAGIIGENFRNESLSHTFNFASQVGAGVEVALSPRLGLDLAYRFRHSSNAGIYERNPAFNVQFFQIGVVYFY